MEPIQNYPAPVDARIVIYRCFKIVILVALGGLALKLLLADTVLIRTDQMQPTLLPGDRVLISKIAAIPPLGWIFRPQRGTTVVFSHPHFAQRGGCLRIAATPGDIVALSAGAFSLVNRPSAAFTHSACGPSLPPDYSPRDAMVPFRIPAVGDQFSLDTLSLRDFIFISAMIRQENPKKQYRIQPMLYIDDSLQTGFDILEFALYSGRIDSIPEDFSWEWFFWDRLQAYLQATIPDKHIVLTLLLREDQSMVAKYTVSQPFYFLLADEWCKGFDSRFIGPVSGRMMRGTVKAVLWSFSPGRSMLSGMRGGRLCKIVR
jgi:signal peptidase I